MCSKTNFQYSPSPQSPSYAYQAFCFKEVIVIWYDYQDLRQATRDASFFLHSSSHISMQSQQWWRWCRHIICSILYAKPFLYNYSTVTIYMLNVGPTLLICKITWKRVTHNFPFPQGLNIFSSLSC